MIGRDSLEEGQLQILHLNYLYEAYNIEGCFLNCLCFRGFFYCNSTSTTSHLICIMTQTPVCFIFTQYSFTCVFEKFNRFWIGRPKGVVHVEMYSYVKQMRKSDVVQSSLNKQLCIVVVVKTSSTMYNGSG